MVSLIKYNIVRNKNFVSLNPCTLIFSSYIPSNKDEVHFMIFESNFLYCPYWSLLFAKKSISSSLPQENWPLWSKMIQTHHFSWPIRSKMIRQTHQRWIILLVNSSSKIEDLPSSYCHLSRVGQIFKANLYLIVCSKISWEISLINIKFTFPFNILHILEHLDHHFQVLWLDLP